MSSWQTHIHIHVHTIYKWKVVWVGGQNTHMYCILVFWTWQCLQRSVYTNGKGSYQNTLCTCTCTSPWRGIHNLAKHVILSKTHFSNLHIVDMLCKYVGESECLVGGYYVQNHPLHCRSWTMYMYIHICLHIHLSFRSLLCLRKFSLASNGNSGHLRELKSPVFPNSNSAHG